MFLDILRFITMITNFFVAVLSTYMGIKTMEKKDFYLPIGIAEILLGGMFTFGFLRNAIIIIMEFMK